MELANPARAAGGAVALQALGAYLLNQFRDAADQRIQAAAQDIVRRIEQGGQAAGLAIRRQVAQLARDAGHSIEEAYGEISEAVTNTINQHWHNNGGEITVDEQWAQEQNWGELMNEADNQALADLGHGEETTLDDLHPGEEDDDSMEPAPEEPAAEARAAAAAPGGGGPNPQSKETPISIYPTLTYGLQETHTTILPWTGWVSYGFLDKTAPLKMDLRLNSIYDIFPNAVLDLLSAGTIAAKGWHNRPVQAGGTHLAGAVFPQGMAAGTTTTERPQWRDFWCQLYDYYTVLGVEWKLTITNTQVTQGGSLLIGMDTNSYTDADGATGNRTPLASLKDFIAFKGITWKNLPVSTDMIGGGGNSMTVLSGRYKPGTIRHNISNDGDVKTWVKTDGSIPALKEFQSFYLFQDALNYLPVGSSGACGNVQIELKYIVQFKDLKLQARYPNSLGGTGGGTHVTLGINPIDTSVTIGQADDYVRYRQ